MNATDRFRNALSVGDREHEFHNVPVDWWDDVAGVWRPTVLDGRATALANFTRIHASIATPTGERVSTGRRACIAKQVLIRDLRPSRLLDDAVSRFFTARYALEVLDDLSPCIASASSADRVQLATVTSDLEATYGDAYTDWQIAFARGGNETGEARGRVVHVEEEDTIIAALPGNAWGVSTAFEQISRELNGGELSCAPVAWWDEDARTWRPTMMLGATGKPSQFMPTSRVNILIPGAVLETVNVCGADLRPLDIASAGFSLCALPVLVRDLLRMHEAMRASGVTRSELPLQPMLVTVAQMLHGAIEEWRLQYDEGMIGDAPEPRVVPLPAEYWGCRHDVHSDDVAARWRA